MFPPAFWPLAARVAVLIALEGIFVAIVRVLKRGPSTSRASLWVRAATWVGLGVIYFVVCGPGPLALALVLAIVAIFALRELTAVFATGGRACSFPLAAAGAVAYILATALDGPLAIPLVAAALAVLVCIDGLVRSAPLRAVVTLLASSYIGIPLALFVVLRSGDAGFAVATWTIATIALCDVTSMVGGLAFGRHQLAASLSPNKTIEGTLAGVCGALVGAAALRFAVPVSSAAVYYGATIAIALSGVAGDLFASSVKRSANRKDFGTALPGHGGIMDRIDSLLFGVPVAWLLAVTIARP
jgi:phosphatidate cytidylyltransferase